jgi:hypothetical protein
MVVEITFVQECADVNVREVPGTSFSAKLPDLLALEAGDQVGVQVLYSPAFVKMLPKSRAGEGLRLASLSDRSVRATVPLLSNRIEIPVTSGMLNNESQEGRSQ